MGKFLLRTLIAVALFAAAFAGFLGEARADIVFLNMNGGATEIPAVQAIARANGERVYLIPKNPGAVEAEDYKTENVIAELLELARNGVRPRTLIVSGHHLEHEGFWGKNGEVSLLYIENKLPREGDANFVSSRDFFASIQNVYLWGCYTGTLANISTLTDGSNRAFPNVQFAVGFGEKGPLNTDPLSGRMLGDVMNKESQMRSGDLAQSYRSLMTVPAVTKKDLIIHRGKSFVSQNGISNQDEFIRNCKFETNRATLERSIRDVWDFYYNRKAIPADTSHGELRLAYQTLQKSRNCIIAGAVNFDEIFEAVPKTGTVLRLIFYKNVIKNFVRLYQSNLQYATKELAAGGINDAEFLLTADQMDRGELLEKIQALLAQIDRKYPYGVTGEKKFWRGYLKGMVYDIREVVYGHEDRIDATWIDPNARAAGTFTVLGRFEKAAQELREQAGI